MQLETAYCETENTVRQLPETMKLAGTGPENPKGDKKALSFCCTLNTVQI